MSPAPNRTEPDSTPAPPRKPSRAPLYAAAALVGAGAIFGLLRSQPEPGSPASDATPSGLVGQAGAPTAGPAAEASRAQQKPQLVIFVPDDNGNLQKRNVALDPRTLRGASGDAPDVLATAAVKELIKASPETFPPGTRLARAVSTQQGAPTLDFNRSFLDESFWQGSARTLAALDSLAMTVGEARRQALGAGGADGAVRIVVEGKPLVALGEMDLRQPYEPSAKAPAEESAP